MSRPSTASTSHPRFVPPPAPRTPKAARTRELLIDVAAELFIERGYEAVSMRDIAAVAGLTKGALYGHFRSKGQLLVEAIRWKLAARENEPGFLDATAADDGGGVGLMYDAGGRQVRLLEVDAAAAARHDPDVAAGLAAFYRDRHERIRDAMGEVHDAESSAWIIAALTAGIGMREAANVPLPDHDRLGETIMAAIRGMTST